MGADATWKGRTDASASAGPHQAGRRGHIGNAVTP